MDKKKKTAADILFYLGMFVLLVIFAGCGGVFLYQKIQENRQSREFDMLRSVIAQKEEQDIVIPGEDGAKTDDADDPERMDAATRARLAAYAVLYEQNPDMIGWVKIDGTQVDYPVVWTPEDWDYYLHRNFEKENSSAGTPYLEGRCRWQEPRTNYLVYGHHMRSGSMFAALDGYEKRDFYEQHRLISFDTLEKTGKYEVAAVFMTSGTGDEVPWQRLLFPEDIDQFEKAWEKVQDVRLYETDAEISYEDHLLALVTCEYSHRDGRLMVVAKEVDT